MKNSIYMTWAKYHAAAKYNLANSGILGCSLNDLTISMDDVVVNGPNHEGYAPLKEIIAERYNVASENVVTSHALRWRIFWRWRRSLKVAMKY